MKTYEDIRRELLTVHATGEMLRTRWYLVGLSPKDKTDMINLLISQVYLVKDTFPRMTWEQAIVFVKKRMSGIKKYYLMDMHHPNKYEFVESFFNGDVFIEEKRWTKKLVKISRLEASNYEDDSSIVKKLDNNGNIQFFKWEHRMKLELTDSMRTEWLKSGKNKRFDILNNIIGESDNRYIREYIYLEQMVDMYKAYKKPYAEIAMSYKQVKSAPYGRTQAYYYLREFFTKCTNIFGGRGTGFERDVCGTPLTSMDEVLEAYALLDMLLKERKRGYSVTDILNR